MSRGYRRVLAGALTLTLPGCFSPTGSVSSITDSDAGTTATPTITTSTATSATTGTTDASQGTDTALTGGTTIAADTTDTTDAADTTASTGPGATAGTTTTDVAQCGDGVVDGAEACDDGPDNGDAQPCRSDCSLAVCGDGVVCGACRPAELCDDGNQIDDDACDQDCQPTPCGDGVLDAIEECDDGNQLAGDGCSARCLQERQYMFVSSIKAPGNFTGLIAADLLCAGLAATKFNTRRKFVAWLSVVGTPAHTRIGVSPLPYVTPSGVKLADHTTDLLDGSLAVPLLEDEDGVALPTSPACDGFSGVWTGTTFAGAVGPDTCSDWSTTNGQGLSGNFGLADNDWTEACPLPCDRSLRVFCIEKAP